MKPALPITIVTALCTAGLAVSWGQTSAQISGRVADSTDAAVPTAAVTAINEEKRTQRTTVTDDTGNYSVFRLEPGKYQITVQKEGFRPLTHGGIVLDVNQSARIDFVLEVGPLSQTIEVAGGLSLLESATAQLGTLVTEEKIEELPLNGRNFTQLLMLTPGAIPVSVGQNRNGAQIQRVGTFMFPAVNGQQNRSNSFTLDGVYNNGHFMGTYVIAPSVDALSQFKVVSHSDNPEVGGVAGGLINIATKGGTNDFHGTFYEFFRNDVLDARDVFADAKTALRFNQFGATVGGPITRDHTFFFFSYDGFRRVDPSSSLTRVPTTAELRGDFSADGRRIFDPFSTRSNPSNPDYLIRTPFPDNTIPVSMINASTKAWADVAIPAPVQTSVPRFNHRNNDSQRSPADQFNARIDQNVSAKDFLWVRATWGEQARTQTQALAGTFRNTWTPAVNIGARHTHVFGQDTLVTGLVGFSSLTEDDQFFITERTLIADGLFEGIPASVNAPGMTVPNAFGTIDGRIRKLGPQKAWQFRGDVSHVKGKHAFNFGGEVVRQPWQNIQDNPEYVFSTRHTGDLNNLASTGSDVASFLLGVYDQASAITADFALESQLWNLYVQDSWNATNNLTLNFGLRWDLLRTPEYSRNAPATWDFATGLFLVGRPTPPPCEAAPPPCLPDPGNAYNAEFVRFTGSSKLRRDDYGMFGPRFGFAYRLRPTTVVRGSFGIFFDLIAGVNQQAQNGSKWPNTNGVTRRGANRTLVEATADDPFGEQRADFPEPTPEAQSGFLFDPRFRQPYSQQWNLEVQREFAGGEVLSIGYVGSHNLRLAVSGSYNTALTPAPGPIEPRKLWPHAPIADYDRSIGQSWYNGLQVKAERRFRRGFSYLLSYTWSKSIDVASSGQFGAEDMSLQNPYDPNSSRSVSGFDVPHHVSFAAVYELPFGRGKGLLSRGLASRIFGNWQINSIVTFRTGQPFTPVTNLDTANIGGFRMQSRTRPDLVADPKLRNPTPERWFSTAAFAAPLSFTFGSAGRNILRSDSVQNFDLSLFREDQLSEDLRLQFRVEFFNAFNHPSFGIPEVAFTSDRFGQVSSTISTSRQVQFGLKLFF